MKVYKNNVIEGLKDLASYDFQKAIWFENEYKIYSSFDEDVETVFFDSGLSDALAKDMIVFGYEADSALKELERLCDSIGYEWSGRERELLESSEMVLVRGLAKDCLRLMRSNKFLEGTVEITNSGMVPHGLSFPDRDNL